jgi:MarR family transcriptional regulator, organic hydroperoxide resistance regulator
MGGPPSTWLLLAVHLATAKSPRVRCLPDTEMPDLKLLFSELVRFETEIWNAIDARLRAQHGLPLSRFEPMQVIGSRANCRVHDVAAALSLTTGGTSKIVDAIEAAGYCRRRRNPDDRRSSIVELTPAGRRLLAKATKTFDAELETRLGSVLPDRSLQQLTSYLVKLREAERARSGKLAA